MKTQEIHELISEFLEAYPVLQIEEKFWDIQMSLLFSTDFQEWGASNQYAAFSLLRKVYGLLLKLEETTKNLSK